MKKRTAAPTFHDEPSRPFLLDTFDGPQLSFDGWKLADVSSRRDPPRIDEDGCERWSVVRIYFTTLGHYVGESLGCSTSRTERTLIETRACKTLAELHAHLGCGWLSMKAYRDAGLDLPSQRV